MPKYRVTTDVGEGIDGDDEPMASQQDACDDAQIALAEMAKEQMPLDRKRHSA